MVETSLRMWTGIAGIATFAFIVATVRSGSALLLARCHPRIPIFPEEPFSDRAKGFIT
jgi:hypothetical protein